MCQNAHNEQYATVGQADRRPRPQALTHEALEEHTLTHSDKCRHWASPKSESGKDQRYSPSHLRKPLCKPMRKSMMELRRRGNIVDIQDALETAVTTHTSDAVPDDIPAAQVDAGLVEGTRVRIVCPRHPNEGRIGVLMMNRAPLLGSAQKHWLVQLSDGQRIWIANLAWVELACQTSASFRSKLFEKTSSGTSSDVFTLTDEQRAKRARSEARAARPIRHASTAPTGGVSRPSTSESQLPSIVRAASSWLLPHGLGLAESRGNPEPFFR